MRLLLSQILLFVYLLYFTAATFPVLNYYLYQQLDSLRQQSAQTDTYQPTENQGDFNYLNAIKKRAAIPADTDKNMPVKFQSENNNLIFIVSTNKIAFPVPNLNKLKYYYSFHPFIDMYAEVLIPPPKSV
jgi:hypothetical protein